LFSPQDAHQLCEAFSRHLSSLPWTYISQKTQAAAPASVEEAAQGQGVIATAFDAAAELEALQRITQEYEVRA
jgi:hypothetical protein